MLKKMINYSIKFSEGEMAFAKWLDESCNDYYFVNDEHSGEFFVASVDGPYWNSRASAGQFIKALINKFGEEKLDIFDHYISNGEFHFLTDISHIVISPYDNEMVFINVIKEEK